jgi:hypothetical protein
MHFLSIDIDDTQDPCFAHFFRHSQKMDPCTPVAVSERSSEHRTRYWRKDGCIFGVYRQGAIGHDWLVKLAFFDGGQEVAFPADFVRRCRAGEPGFYVKGHDPELTIEEFELRGSAVRNQ